MGRLLSDPFPPIAVVGLGALFPGGSGVQSFWSNIVGGRDLLSDVPATHWLTEDFYNADPLTRDKVYSKRGGFLDPVDFDFSGFGVPPTILPATDAAQLLALVVAKQAMTDAQGAFHELDRERTSVILGVASATQLCVQMAGRLQRPVWVKALRELGMGEDQVQEACEKISSHFPEWQENTFPGMLGNVVAGRIANRLDLGGSNCVIDAACASSLGALHLALDELYLGQSDAVITGGVDALNDILMYMCFSKTGALSKSDDCRPFTSDADGTMMGEGVGMVMLRRLEDAEREGNPIYALIRGCGASSDGRSKSIYAPRADGQVRAYLRAYEHAGYGPESVELVEAHGTGTVAGDAAELAGLKTVFSNLPPKRCALGSIKSQIGHTKAAAGAASLLKVVLSLQHKVLPPIIKAENPAAEILAEGGPFYLNPKARPWIRDDAQPRRASLSSFGFGGSNFHVTLEEYLGTGRTAPRTRTTPCEVILVGADTPANAAARCRELGSSEMRPGSLGFLAHQSQTTWKPDHRVRLAIVAANEADLTLKLNSAAESLAKLPTDHTGEQILGEGISLGIGSEIGKVAFLFPGQGSQYPDMGADLAMFREDARSAWDLGAKVCSGGSERLQDIVFMPPAHGPDGEALRRASLQRSQWAQPALGTASLATYRVLTAVGIVPDLTAGHSFGEVVALHAAKAISEEDMLKTSRARGEAMAAAATIPGAMSAVVGPVEVSRKLLADLEPELVFANHNSPQQMVISGTVSVIEAAEARLEKAGVRFVRLPVASAFHTPIVAGARDAFGAFLNGISLSATQIPVIACSTAQAYPHETNTAKALLADQLAKPVLFVEQVEELYRQGARTFIEVGPNAVLTGLVEACLKGRPFRALATDRRGVNGITSLWNLLAKLAVAGVPIRWEELWHGFIPQVDPIPVGKPKPMITLTGALYQKPYPPVGGGAALPAPNPTKVIEAPRAAPAPAIRLDLPPVPPTPVGPQETAWSNGLAYPSDPQVNGHVYDHSPTFAQDPSETNWSTEDAFDDLPAPEHHEFEDETEMDERTQSHVVADSMFGQIAEAQRDFQHNMLRGHQDFLRTMESLARGGGGRAPSSEISPVQEAPRVRRPALQAPAPEPVRYEAPRAVAPPASLGNGEASHYAPKPTAVSAPIARSHAPAVVHTPEPIAGLTVEQVTDALLETVVETTGYPRDVLGLEMELEGDLGVDSIKRVEIFSALQTRLPSLPELPMDELGPLKTLGEIVNLIKSKIGETKTKTAIASPALNKTNPISSPGSVAHAQTNTISAPSGVHLTADQVTEALLETVVKTTGYPRDVLGLGMELEGDLGVDSIKRVEIFSALQSALPGLPELPMEELAPLKTLGEIVELISKKVGSAPPQPNETKPIAASARPAQAPAPAQLSAAQVTEALLETVVKTTGYPRDVLGLGMELEGDLGVDSIKRVEIFSALQSALPGLPELPMDELGPLKTLGEIVAYINTKVGGAPTAAAVAAASVPTQAQVASEVSRSVWRAVEKGVSGFAGRALRPEGLIGVTDDGNGVADAVCDELEEAGLRAVVVHPGGPIDEISSLIVLDGLRSFDSATSAGSVHRSVLESLRWAGPRLAQASGELIILQDTGGSFGLVAPAQGFQAWAGGLSALARTAGVEWPTLAGRTIDCERGTRTSAEIAKAIVSELLCGGDEHEVGLMADGRRFVLRTVSEPTPIAANVLTDGDVIIAVGGARGVTAACLVELAGRTKLKIALLGRTRLHDEPSEYQGAVDQNALVNVLLTKAKERGESITPADAKNRAGQILAEREVRNTLILLQTAGSEAIYLPADSLDASATSTAVGEVRKRWGAPSGVIFAAGVLADKLILEKTNEQFDKVFSVKVQGITNILAATADDPLKVLAIFSSVAAISGNKGQSDYAAANAVLNQVALAESRRRAGRCLVKSFCWGPWDGGMVTPSLRKHFLAMGIPLLGLKEGSKLFADELAATQTDVVLVMGGSLEAPKTGTKDDFRFSVQAGAKSMPYLADHTVRDIPVVAAAVVVELFARGVHEAFPGRRLGELEQMRVLRGVPLPEFETRSVALTVVVKPTSDANVVRLELCDATGHVRYSATGKLVAAGQRIEPPTQVTAPTGEPWPFEMAEIYDGPLFHGPSFHAITGLGTMATDGGSGQLIGTTTMKWAGGPYLTDPVALDGCLQLPMLWAGHSLQRQSLPALIGRLILCSEGPSTGPLHCDFRGQIRRDGLSAEVLLRDQTGRPVMYLGGLEMYALTSSLREETVR